MRDTVIRVEGLGKQYRIGRARARHDTLRDALVAGLRAPADRLRQRLPSAIRHPPSADTIWALKDLSLEVKRGEAVGVVGPNGAGKTTLLKLLSRITRPTEGWADVYGRVGSLLEVGTGFHPELTGRENIYLNGAILGMKRAEIDRKFDEIVAFSEIEAFLDTPVKRYSSGMYVRLAFAVAAHLEPEILLVDEVLAVGDAAFQQKCLGKMEDVAQEGRTVLFVSHNMGAIGRLCRECLLLVEGRRAAWGETQTVLDQYLSTTFEEEAELVFAEEPAKPAQVRRLGVRNHRGEITADLDVRFPFTTEVEYEIREGGARFYVAWILERADGTRVCGSTDLDSRGGQYLEHEPGRYVAWLEFPGGVLNAGAHTIQAGIAERGGLLVDHRYGPRIHLRDGGSFASTILGGRRLGVLLLDLPWTVRRWEEGP